jgi:diguanylate cyclase (GGDEF)-like protein
MKPGRLFRFTIRSLNHTIILLFAIIITPIASVLVYQAVNDARHASSVKFEVQSTVLARRARDNYRVFANGVAEVVDTGSLSTRARQALKNTRESLLALEAWDPSFRIEPFREPIDTLLNATQGDPSLEALLPLRPVASRVNGMLTALVDAYELRQNENVDAVAQAVKQQVWIALTAMLVTLASAVGFVVLLIRGLTGPLRRAVALAEKVAAGDFTTDGAFDTERDIGGLLASLAAMRGRLNDAFLASSAHLRYQEKIARFGYSALGRRDPSELIEQAVQTVLEGLTADAVAFVERGQDEREVILRAVVGLPNAHQPAVASYAPQDALAQVLERGEPTHLSGSTPAAAALPFEWADALRGAVLVPVRGAQRVRGALCALSANPGAFGHEEAKFVDAAASVLSAGLQRIDSDALALLAHFDALTGLPNRALLSDRFAQMIAQAQRRRSALGVLFIDLDEFKLVNDTLGHAGGDELLKETGRRLKSSVRSADTVARISGDEFAIILADLSQPEDAAPVAQKIIERLAEPFEVLGQEVFVTASIGIALFPSDGHDSETLLSAADAAMYRAKQSRRNAYQFFTAEINERTRERAQLVADLRYALERDEFALAYQPKIDLKAGRPCGAEALLRWHHPKRGVVSPAEFVPVLEKTGLIVPLGEWVLRRVCVDLKAWMTAGLPPLPVAVNLSTRQFRQPRLDARICSVLKAEGVDPALIELEITENQLMQEHEQAIRIMQALRGAGIRIAIDHFGTGYSSLAYLMHFPISALKIDRSFIKDLSGDASAAAIVRAIIEMAHALGFTVIAEGVESAPQAEFLRRHGCEQAQGDYFARPMPVAEFTALIAAGLVNM